MWNIFFFTTFFFLQNLLCENSISQTWTQKASFPGTPRFAATGFSIDGKGYIGTGYDGGVKKDFWEFDSGSNSWTQKADFGGTARFGATGLAINNLGYVGMGSENYPVYNFINDFWEFNPAVNSWTQKTNFTGQPRYTPAQFSIGNKGFVGTGWDQSTPYFNDFFEYNPLSDTWIPITDFSGSSRQSSIGFSIGSKGYLGTGWDGGTTSDFWEYDTTSNSWTQKADFSGTARYGAVGVSSGSNGYIITGGNGSIKYNDFWEYDPSLNTWSQLINFGGTARDHAVGFFIDSCIYLGTGRDNSGLFVNDFWAYCGSCSIPVANISSGTANVCTNEMVEFNNNSNGATSYFWNFDDGYTSSLSNPVHSYTDSGLYNIFLVAYNSCGSDTDYSTVVCVLNNLTFTLTNDTVIEAESLIALIVDGGTNYLWNNGETSSSVTVNPASTAIYYVTVTDANGCSRTDSVKVEIRSCNISVPTIFSPNNDGKNDKIFVHLIGVSELGFFIYDRWGGKVFESHEANYGWDGTFNGNALNSSVFVYYAEATCNNGEIIREKGNITLVK